MAAAKLTSVLRYTAHKRLNELALAQRVPTSFDKPM
jgi:hypothetical protein